MSKRAVSQRGASIIAIVATAAIGLAACGGGRAEKQRAPTAGPSRSFMMGLSTLPRELNAQSYSDAIQLAADTGEIVLIQRAPPWSDFTPGASISDETAKTTASEKDAIASKHLKLFFAIDPTDGATGRDRLANLPPSLSGRNFGDDDVRSAFLSYAQYVALNYQPTYLALGVEMNLYYGKNRSDFDNFRSLYAAARDAVKAASPHTQVTVTFQYEDLQGLLPTENKHFADWDLFRSFNVDTDFAAISTYPSFAFGAASQIPENYYSQLRAFTDKPIAVAEAGYASEAGAQGVNSGTESEQAAFVDRLVDEAGDLHMPFVIWFAGWDPAYAKDTAFSVFEHIGLRRDDDTEKPAWAAWAAASQRPYDGSG